MNEVEGVGGEGTPPAPRRQGEILPRRADIGKNMIDGSKVYFNLGQEVIITTRDKLKLSLMATVPRYADRGLLLGKLGIFVALLLAVVTTQTKDAFGLSASTWSTLLVIFTIVSGLWTAREVYRYFAGRTIDGIVDEVVKESRE